MKSASKKSPAKPAKDRSSFFQKKNDTGFFNEQANHPSFFGKANGVQAKLTVGQPNDKYEKEADHTADKVLQQLNAPPGNSENNTVQNKLAVPGISPLVQEKCKDCEEKDKQEKDEKSVQRKSFANSGGEDEAVQRKCDDCEEEENLQKKESSSGAGRVSPSVESGLSSGKGSGSPLPKEVNQSMSTAFGSDFSKVRVHTDAEATQMSQQLNAQAFTHGSDIYFNSGKYDTDSKEGQHLLAHELTHTVQQGAVSPSNTSSVIQRDGNTTTDPNQPPVSNIPGPPYEKDGYKLTNEKGVQTLTVPKVSLPAFKKRNEAMFKKDLAFMAGRIETAQVSQWKEDVKDGVGKSTDNFLKGKGKSLKGDAYFFKSGEFVIFGKAEKLKRDFQIPEWDRTGKPRSHAVDHIVELQLGGQENATNYELLESIANSAIGSVIQKEIYRRIKDGIKFFKDNNVPNVPTFREVTRKDNPTTLVFFHEVDKWDLKPSKGDPEAYWSIAEVKSGKPLEKLQEMDLTEVQKLEGSDKKLHLFVKPGEGVPHSIEMPAKKQPNWLPGVDLLAVNLTNPNAADDTPMGTVSIALQPEVAKKINAPSSISIPFTKIPGLINAGALVFAGVTENLKTLFSFPGLSPIKITSFDLNDNGLLISGTITAENPLIDDASIDFSIAGNELRISKTFSLGELKGLPSFLKVTDVSLTVFASTEFGFGVEGDIDFEIGQIGKGTLTGIGATADGFGVKGEFSFNSKKFKGSKVWFSYLKKEWSGGGKIAVTDMTGVEKGELTVEYKDKVLTAQGEATLKIPGISKAQLKAVFDKDGGMDITGGVQIKKLPGIKGGLVTVHVSKTADKPDYSLSVTGEVEPDLPKIPNVTTKMVVSYDNGLFKAEVIAKYAKGKLEGDITIGVTNGIIDGEGKVQKAQEGATDLKFYGNGSLTITLVKSMKWTLSVFIDTKGEILLSAVIKIHSSPFDTIKPKPIDLFHIDKNIPLIGIPFANVFLKVGAGASIFFEWEPLVIDFETTLDKTPLEDIKKGKLGGTSTLKLSSIAKAGIQLDVKVGAGVAVTVLALSVNVTGSVGVGITGKAGAEINADWDSEKGLKFKDATFKVEVVPQAILALKGTIEAELDLIVSSVKIYTYNLGEAKREIDIKGLSFNAELPVSFDETGAVKKADVEKLVPKLDAASGEKMLKQGITGEGSDTPEPVSQEDTAKQKIKNQIYADLKAKLASKQSSDIVTYASSLQRKYGNVADQKLRTFVLATVEGEMRSVTAEEFENIKNDLRLSKDPLATKLQRITEFERRFTPFFNKEDTTILRNELKQQAADQEQPPVQKKPIFESNNDEDERVQKKTEAGSVNQARGEETLSDSIQNTEERIQRVPQAGEVLPSTDKQQRYYKYRNEVVNILGNASFEPSRGLANYISSMWENHQEPAVNVKVGNLGEGYIFLKPGAGFIKKDPICVPVTFGVSLCVDRTPDTSTYTATRQVIPIIHPAFGNRDDGTVVYVVEIINGFIKGDLGWIPGKKAISIDPLLDVALAQTGEGAFLPLIYGKEYDGTNYVSAFFKEGGTGSNLFFLTSGILQLPNQQKIEGSFSILNESYKFEANLIGKPEGLDTYKAPVTRTPDTLLTAETTTLVLDANWTSGKADDEDGAFTASSQLRLSYANGILEIFGSAKYASARFNGEVNVTVTTKSQSEKLFAEHAAEIAKEKKGVGLSGSSDKENPEEPLALTAWGDLSFKIIDTENKAAAAGAGAGAKKSPLENLEGKASFVVSSDGFIILAGRVKLPTNWKLTPKLDYTSTDPENKDKHLFQHEQSIVEAWVPEAIGSIEVKVGIVVDADAHLDPLELYEIEVSGVYSNHPKYRSEVNLTPKFFISGNAGAKVSVSAEGIYKFLGLIKTASIKGTVTGEARIEAYIDAAPTVSRIWGGDDKAAAYALSGIIQTGGEITFTLTGSLHLEAFGAKLLDSEDYQIGRWTLKRFAVELKMDEYLLGSGGKPNIDYGKMGMNDSQRHSLGQSITEEIEGKKTGPDTRAGGFEQEEGGKMKEKGTFSATPPPPRPDHGKDAVDNRIEENFLMGNRLHDLVIIIGGTRESPTAILKMASGNEEPLVDKIEDEKIIVELKKAVTADPVEQKRIDTRLRDLQSIEREAKNVEKNAKETAQEEPVKDPKVAGFDQIDDRIADYAQKYDKEDLGTIIPSPDPKGSPPTTTPTTTPTPATPTTPGTSTAGGTTADLKKLKVGDLLSVPYKNGRGRGEVLEITKDFVTILIKTKSRSSDIKNMIPRSRFKDMLDNGDIFIWSELRRFLMNNRPKYVTGLVDQVWNNASAVHADGKVRDPNPPHEILTWHRSQSRYAQWHMGHKPGHKYSDLVDQLVNEEIDWDQFIEEYNRPDNYHPELPSKNMGHGFEEAEQP
jgi:hypothetical protein